MTDVVVIGAGPVGMLLAGELTRWGIAVTLLERRPAAGGGSRAIGVHAPALAALEPSGVTERLLSEAVRVHRGEARSRGEVLGVVRFDRLATRFPFVATLPQAATEAVLAADAPEPLRGVTVTDVEPRADGIHVRAEGGSAPVEIVAPLVVVAGGAGSRSLAYRPGAVQTREYRDRYVMTDADAAGTANAADAAVAVVHLDRDGVLESFPLPGGRRRFVAWDAPDAASEPSAQLARLRTALRARGEAAIADAVTEVTRFGVRRVVASGMRNGRIFVVGDAAHEVSPIGGQGMNLGLLDAVRLAPLLAQWVRTDSPPEPELRAWERRRLASSRTAARLAALNTRLGRPLPVALDRLRCAAVRGMLGPATATMFARAYAMGFDRDA